jgi:hypothetical protein
LPTSLKSSSSEKFYRKNSLAIFSSLIHLFDSFEKKMNEKKIKFLFSLLPTLSSGSETPQMAIPNKHIFKDGPIKVFP